MNYEPLQYSRFLPKDFNPLRPVVVIAGKGIYPKVVVNRLKYNNIPVKLIAFKGEDEKQLLVDFCESDRAVLRVGQIGKFLRTLEEFSPGYAILAGQISPRRLFGGLWPDWTAMKLLKKIKERNASTIFGSIVEEIEKLGIKVLDARSFFDEDLAHEGVMTTSKWQLPDSILKHGIRTAKIVSSLDIGQSVVVSGGTVIAIEAFEGTNKMIKRGADLCEKSKLFVKCPKVDQDFRFDVPVIGPETLDLLRVKNYGYVAVEAGKTIILNKKVLLEEAGRIGVRFFGFTQKTLGEGNDPYLERHQAYLDGIYDW